MFGINKPKINTDPKKIEEVLTRSIDTIYPDKKSFESLLLSGKQLRIYMGIDPTATYAHLGHSTNYIILKRFHNLGHKIIVLIGDFTAMIGDPSDKSGTRKRLTKEQVSENLKTFKKQIGKILNFNDTKNPIEFRFNSEWLSKLNFNNIVDLASNFTVQRMLERDIFQKRIAEQKPLYVHEFFYPLMQGYDSVALDADVEIGGTDQTFNMLAGRTLLRNYKNKEKIVVTTTLLEHPVTGEKLMSKSLGTGIGMDETANDMFGKVMSMYDEAIPQLFTDCTELSLSEIDLILRELEQKENYKEIKMRLAREIVTLYHGQKDAEKAEENWIKTFSEGGVPDDILTINVSDTVTVEDKLMVDVLLAEKVVESKTDWRRLVSDGAVTNMNNEEKITDSNIKAIPGTYKIGKRRFVKIVN